MLKEIQDCFKAERLYYSGHARNEMEVDEFGEIKDEEVVEAVLRGKIIEIYPEDKPYPSCLIYGRTSENRALHVVCAYSNDDNTTIIITAYQPHPDRWINFIRRKK
jgi:hypothetical protein